MNVAISDLRANLKTYIDRVKAGERIVVTDRRAPVARLGRAEEESLLARLEREGVLTRARTTKRPIAVKEPGRDIAVEMWNGADRNFASRLAVPEVGSAIATARRFGRLDATAERAVRRRWAHHAGVIEFVELLARIGADAADLAAGHELSGADAVHLASALTLREMDLALVSWAGRLTAAAAAEGLPVVPGDF